MLESKPSYKTLKPALSAEVLTKQTNEQRFWRKYENVNITPGGGIVSTVCSNGNDGNILVFGQGRSVHIYDEGKIVRSMNNFDLGVTAATIRWDGKMIAVGDESGKIEVMDTKQKFHLRTFKNHKKRVNSLHYFGNDLYSGGDDMILRLFDIAAGEVVHSYDGAHDDYIRCVKGLENTHLLSGGYDGKVKLFDFRVHSSPQLIFHHATQVQSIDVFPSKLNFIVGGERKITTWDIRNNKPIFINENHKKTVNCVKVISQGSRFLSVSSDQSLKVYRSDNFHITYQEKYSSGILSCDITSDNQIIGLGLQNQQIWIKERKNRKENEMSEDEREVEDEIGEWLRNNEKQQSGLNGKYFYRGVYQKPNTYDVKFERIKLGKGSQYDGFLKKFQYKKALLTCLRKKNMTMFISLIDEYIQRDCLDRTLKTLNEEQAQQVVTLISLLLHDIRYNELSIQLLQQIINIPNKNSELHREQHSFGWEALQIKVKKQLSVIDNMLEVEGMLQLIQSNYL